MNLDALRSYIVKIAYVPTTPKMKVEVHHSDSEKDWKAFEKNLKSKGFQTAARKHKLSDAKLKRYVKNYGGYLTSKEVVGIVPSRTSGKNYKLKKLPDGRIGCGCKDWQFKHSHKGTDCDHILEFNEGVVKESSLVKSIAQGVSAARTHEKMKEQGKRGALIHENVRRLRTGEDLIPLGYHR